MKKKERNSRPCPESVEIVVFHLIILTLSRDFVACIINLKLESQQSVN